MRHPPQAFAVHAGGLPLPRAVEVGDLRHAAQVAGVVGVGARLAIPVVRPERLPAIGRAAFGQVLPEPASLALAVEAIERHGVTGDLIAEVGQQGRRQAARSIVLSVAGDDV